MLFESRKPLIDHGLVRCVDEDGIECRLRLYTTKPMWYGTFKLVD